MGSVVVDRPNSGLLVLPKIIRPEDLYRLTRVVSSSAISFSKSSEPLVVIVPFICWFRFLITKGTPLKGPFFDSASC